MTLLIEKNYVCYIETTNTRNQWIGFYFFPLSAMIPRVVHCVATGWFPWLLLNLFELYTGGGIKLICLCRARPQSHGNLLGTTLTH